MNSDYHMEIYGSENFYEKQAKLEDIKLMLDYCKEQLKGITEFENLVSHIDIALDEVRRLEREEF